VADARRDFLHKISTRLVRENDVIAVEDLNVCGMIRNRRLAPVKQDARPVREGIPVLSGGEDVKLSRDVW
jgi:transposase